MGDHLRIGGGLEDAALLFQLGMQLLGVDEVPVVRDGQIPLTKRKDLGLRVGERAGAGGGVAHVAGGGVARQRGNVVGGKDLAHQTHPTMVAHVGAVHDGDAGAAEHRAHNW